MKEQDRVKIKIIKSKITEMLVERQQVQNGHHNAFNPSSYWTNFCSYFDYMLGLPEESFAKLRLHTYHLNGDNYQTYIFKDPHSYRAQADKLTKNIPTKLILNEPEGGIGYLYNDGRFLSRDILRFQRVINTLHQHDILDSLSDVTKQKRKYVLEIGAGYGGLVHHLSNILENTTFIIVDLPEVLLFSAAYLSLLNPHKRMYLYSNQDFLQLIGTDVCETYDFVLIPNYQLDSLRHLQFDLVLNISSLQEMTVEQVETYLNFIQATTTGVFYSLNQDSNLLTMSY
ncbi:MAG: putative sugar O-methyltransferase [Anaerolineales bacterium]|nr:putative sugar O-methyltransferase [Anaerolineales bacterium]